jgi:CBS domain-containing protein
MIDSLTPLIAIDAIALDTETTGLDVRTASVIEIGAVRIVSGVLRPEQSYLSLVRPLGKIDPAAIDVHGIDDVRVRDAPQFQHVWPEFAAFATDGVVVGHSLGFDLAIIERQLASCGLTWRRPRMLDTELLSQLASPGLGRRSLDELAERLELELEGRHSALGDATIAGNVFLALLPALQRVGIQTLEEAETSCRSLTRSLDDYRRANWIEPIAPPAATLATTAPERRDLYAYRYRVTDVMSSPPSFMSSGVAAGEALSLMLKNGISSVFVASAENERLAERAGIVTERDLLRAFANHRSDAFVMPVGELMNRPLVTVPADAFAYLAVARMRRLRIRHLAVVDGNGVVVGAVSARDMLRMQGEPAILVGDEIATANSVQSLSKAWAKLRMAVSSMMSDVPARELAGLISQALGELTARAAALAERGLSERGLGPPPCAYAVAVLGSAGREESLLTADQDNALVFLQGAPDGPEDRWFAALGSELADILNSVGIPYCPGGVMAKNAAWRGSVQTWEHRIESWIGRSLPQELLSVDIFFDMKPVYGDAALALSLWQTAFERARGNVGFTKLLVEASVAHMTSGLTWFGRFRNSQGRVDLKRAGTFGLVTAARALAIRHHVVERSTYARFAKLRAKDLGHEIDFGHFEQALSLFLALMLRQQITDIGMGIQPGNTVAIQALSRYEREQLRAALSAVTNVDAFVRDLLF